LPSIINRFGAFEVPWFNIGVLETIGRLTVQAPQDAIAEQRRFARTVRTEPPVLDVAASNEVQPLAVRREVKIVATHERLEVKDREMVNCQSHFARSMINRPVFIVRVSI
jgi:hypothetical protein